MNTNMNTNMQDPYMEEHVDIHDCLIDDGILQGEDEVRNMFAQIKAENEQAAKQNVKLSEKEQNKQLINELCARRIELNATWFLRKGRKIRTGIKMYTTENDPCHLPLEGISIITARTSGGKTTWLVSLLSYFLAVINNTQPDMFNEQPPRYFPIFISLEEPIADIAAKATAAYGFYNAQRNNTTVIPTRKEVWKYLYYSSRNKDYILPDRTEENTGKTLVSGEALTRTIIANYDHVMNNAVFVDKDDIRALNEKSRLAQLPKANAVCDLIAASKELGKERGLTPIIFLDYAQRIKNDGKSGERYLELQNIIQAIAEQTYDGTVVVLGAQSNRSVADYKDPVAEIFKSCPEVLRESADLEQTANVVLYNVTHGDRFYSKIVKNRNGRKDTYANYPVKFSYCAIDFNNVALLQEEDMPKSKPRAKGKTVTLHTPPIKSRYAEV